MKTTTALLSLLASVALACTHGGAARHEPAPAPAPATPPPAAGGDAASRMRAMCPMDVPGTQLSASDSPTGEVLTFTTTAPDQVPALRERVRGAAAMHGQHHAGMHPGSGGDAGGMTMPPPSRTQVEDVENGARVLVTPEDPADLQKLQTTVRTHAEHMQQHGCEMMGGDAAHH